MYFKRFVLAKIPGFMLVWGFLMFSCSDSAPRQNEPAISPSSQNNPPAKETDKEPEKKSDLEQTIEIVNVAVNVGKDLIKNKRMRDSIKMEEREKMFAYQLGFPVDNLDQVFDLYGSLDDKESVYILKKSKHDYFIIKYEGKSEKELNDSLEIFRGTVPEPLSAGIQVINIAGLCSRKEKLMVGENLTKRKHDEELPCLVCEK